MDRQNTQFWVAIVGMAGLVGITALSVVGASFGDTPLELTFALVTGLISITSTAGAWLFRIENGKRQNGGGS